MAGTLHPSLRAADPADLRVRIHRLWQDEPMVSADRRASLLAELAQLDMALDRVELRRTATPGAVDGFDEVEELAWCLDGIESLESSWRPPATSRFAGEA